MDMLIDVKGWKAIGNKLSSHEVKEVHLISSEPLENELKQEEPEEEQSEDLPNDSIEVGSTISLTPKKGDEEQLGLF